MNRTRIAERELTADEALLRIHAELNRLGLEPFTRTLGHDIVAVQASLRCINTRLQARGAGKGYPDQARLGALYEALEHYWTDELPVADLHFVNAQYFAQTIFRDDVVQQFVARQNNALIACRTYTCPTNENHFSYPIALSSPHFCDQTFEQDTANYHGLRRYSSNSGTAIGANYNEALLHAANECIERDAVSLFLLNHFYYENHPPLHRVSRLGEGDSLGRLWADAEREIGTEIVLVDISNEFKARTFLAFSMAPGTHLRVFGTGCSLDARHGAWRALTELVQLHHGASEPEYRHHLMNAQRHLQRFPRLLRCLQFNPHALLHLSPQRKVVLPDAGDETPLAEQINQLTADLQRHGRTLGVAILNQTELGTTLVNVVIPGLERFFIVSSGNVVIPQARGQQLEKKPLGVSA